MPRTARVIESGCPYHVMNRGNGRMMLFHKPADYDAFARVLIEALSRYEVELFAYCLMPNHWHLLLRERDAGALSALMRWVGVTHVRRHHEHYHTRGGGHLYQGRFKSFPVASGPYFRSVAHYVEANARRAALCDRAEDWRWGSAVVAPSVRVPLTRWPCRRPDDWRAQLNASLSQKVLDEVRRSVAKGRPLGPPAWAQQTAAEQGLTQSLRDVGRPRKKINE